ncbi:hypothetical protein [Coraliomargarita parva]|uniref:hypothetical protein n=1 Tax=Coraliomargarita parva TaxID=3014050 RepID=UPI0022B51B37|nr:hypothetical protein [Coraliomargarita parva]
MQSEEDPALTLSKWPFYLGDLLLVATALAIAVLGQWDLSNWQVASCVTAVALGAALLCLPYLFEHWMRTQDLADDQSAEIRVLQRQVRELAQAIVQMQEAAELRDEQLQDLGHAGDRIASLVDAKLAQFKVEVPEPEVDPDLPVMKEGLADLAAARDRHSAELASLTEQFKRMAEQLAATQSRMEATEAGLKGLSERPAQPLARPVRSPRNPKKPEARLLHRAIKDKAVDKSEAVSRIIQAKARSEEVLKEPETQPRTEALEPEPSDPEATADSPEPRVVDDSPAEEDTPLEATEIKGEEAVPELVEAPPSLPVNDAEASERTEAAETEPELTPEVPRAPEPPPAEEHIDLEAEVPPMEASDMLFDDMPEAAPAKKARIKKNDTTLTIHVLIGIGNKPYLRGSGAGLNWESGILMEFESIGTWRWIAPAEMEETIEICVYRNDEDPDKTGKHRLEPGQKLEIEPKF